MKPDETRHVPKLTGPRRYLSPMTAEDAELYTQWLNDQVVTEGLAVATKNITLAGEREYIAKGAVEHSYSVVARDTNRLIGNVALVDLDYQERTAEIGVFIGDRDYWGQGYGAEAMGLLMAYAFDVLNIRNIWLRVFDFNQRAITSYLRLGFREVGRRRMAVRRRGREYDMVFMDILDEEFRESAP